MKSEVNYISSVGTKNKQEIYIDIIGFILFHMIPLFVGLSQSPKYFTNKE